MNYRAGQRVLTENRLLKMLQLVRNQLQKFIKIFMPPIKRKIYKRKTSIAYLGRRRRSCGRGRPLRRFGPLAFEELELRATGATHGTPLGSCAPVI
jgi:hypothetical protein